MAFKKFLCGTYGCQMRFRTERGRKVHIKRQHEVKPTKTEEQGWWTVREGLE